MRRLFLLRCAAPFVLTSLLAGCGGPKMPREELGKVEWGIYAVPGRDERIPLDNLPVPAPARLPTTGG